ncbi:MAG TPA: hypothetical protein VGB53_05645 [Rubricoccaceae bacterium]|jgi:hypothetical protein
MATTYARMTEKQVQRDIVVFLGLLGYLVSDFSQPRASMQTPGIPDLHAMGHGHALWIEVKTAKGVVSPAQAAWHDAARAAGQTVVVARSAADLVDPLRALGAPIAAA